MQSKKGRRAGLGLALASALVLLSAGCQGGGSEALESAEKPKVAESELRAFCPTVALRDGTAFFTSYENAAPPRRRAAKEAAKEDEAAPAPEGEARRIRYQTSITDVTRTCTHSGGNLVMTVAVAGKVVPGPAGVPGPLTLPIRIAFTNGGAVLFTQLYSHPVTVTSATAATQFLFTADAISFPDPNVRSVRGFAGFDEGPAAAVTTN